MHDTDIKNILSIHVILIASDFAKKKMETYFRVVQIGENFAEQTKMGWVVKSPGRQSDTVKAVFTKTSAYGYKKL